MCPAGLALCKVLLWHIGWVDVMQVWLLTLHDSTHALIYPRYFVKCTVIITLLKVIHILVHSAVIKNITFKYPMITSSPIMHGVYCLVSVMTSYPQLYVRGFQIWVFIIRQTIVILFIVNCVHFFEGKKSGKSMLFSAISRFWADRI